MTKSEVIEKVNELSNKLEEILSSSETTTDELRNMRRIIDNFPEEASEIEEDQADESE